ncbi:hypothetical protein RHSIM_RhsimUnG0060900 [Rhododendron simsii]|uniref:C2 domain-containing protein n=1 Tax=Rhododendron simsii TaxID=118357 RepID=A0A834FVT4_RHOSS|nr:hypothetical protein RHSIM_RhsimUnG0060900 [Rhododendron simsii]
MYQFPTQSQCSAYPSMSISGIQGQLLEVTVVGCNKLKDTEWISRQDPYVCLEYGSAKFRTRTCTDGGKNPTFQEKFTFTLIEGLRELNVFVWNSNTLTYDDFIGSGKFNLELADHSFAVCTKRVQLQKVLSEGYDDNSSPLQTKTGRWKTSLLGCHNRTSDVFNDLQVSTGLSFVCSFWEWNEHKVTLIGICLQKEIELEAGSVNFRGRLALPPALFFHCEGREEHFVGVGNKMTDMSRYLDFDLIGLGTFYAHSNASFLLDRHAGEVRLIMHYANANKPATSYAPSAPPYIAPSAPKVSMYSTPPPASTGFYPPPATAYPPPPSAYASYPPNSSPYPSTPYAPPQPSAYPPPYPPPSAYPPPPYPPPPHSSPYPPPPGPFPGIYPPPPY